MQNILRCLIGLILAGGAFAAPVPKKILYFTKSSGFEHSVVKRSGSQPSFSEKILAAEGPRHGIEFTFSKDGSLFTADYLAQFDAFLFYTSGDLTAPGTDQNPPLTPAGKQALLQAVAQGKGFVGLHAATDTFHSGETAASDTSGVRANRYANLGDQADPYVRMIGAEFIRHDKQQVATARLVDPQFPGMGDFPAGFTVQEEWYSLADFSSDLHVILALQTEGMIGSSYQRPSYPNTWARLHGKGRVFYSALGHREDVWTNPLFQKMLFGTLNWASRAIDAEVTPNIDKCTPGAWKLPPLPEPKQK